MPCQQWGTLTRAEFGIVGCCKEVGCQKEREGESERGRRGGEKQQRSNSSHIGKR